MNTFDSVKGKVAIVTGGNSGIGREIAKVFADNGMRVVICGRNTERGEKVVAEITAAGGEAMFVKTDVCNEEEVRTLVDTTIRKYGKLHVMVNNAGINAPLKPMHENSLDDFMRINGVNYLATFTGIKYAVQAMLDTDSRECAVINIASVCGMKASECFGLYDAAKHAVVGLTKSCALDYAKHDITVNAICPGTIDTEMFADASPKLRELLSHNIPGGRFGKPEEIAYMSLFLATDMARFITGSIIAIDGGFSSGDQTNTDWGTPDPRDLSDMNTL